MAMTRKSVFKQKTFIIYLTIGFIVLFYSTGLYALQFNTNETIILKGKNEKLSDNEGYLYLSIDSQTGFKYFTIWHVNGGKPLRFDDVSSGKNHALIKLKAGDYYWVRFKVGNYFYDFKRTQFPFKIEPGVINYPGTWNFAFKSNNNIGTLFINSTNNFSTEYKSLKKHHHALTNDYQFKFQGDVPDHFSQYFHDALTANSDYGINKSKALQYTASTVIEYDKKEGIKKETEKFENIEKYFKDGNQSIGKLNPSGQFLLYSAVEGEYTRIKVLNLQSFESFVIYKEKIPQHSYIEDMQWIDEDSIYYRIKLKKDALNLVAHLAIDNNVISTAHHLVIPSHGKLVDSLLQQDNFIYFGNDSNFFRKKRGLYKIDTSSDRTIKKTLKKHYSKLKKLKGSVYWLTDNESEVRFVIVLNTYKYNSDATIEYWYLPNKESKKWVKIKSYNSSEDLVIPDMLSMDGKYFYVITDKFGDKKSIHKYSTSDLSHQGVFYENSDLSVEGVLTDPSSGEIVGIKYVENGFYKFKYFQTNNDLLKSIRAKNPNLPLFSIHHNQASNSILLLGLNAYTKGSWYLYRTLSGEIFKLFDEDSEYNKLEKGFFHTLKIKSLDDLDIEGYLVMPEKSKHSKVPLIVIPHGGPIGVRDYAYETDMQHFYASQGFATLKINYRGSSGYGKKFKESGNLQWGKKIEIDINTMVNHVIDKYQVNANKICSMGASYGGYSAIMLTILYPDRYKCAVSLAGVMDIPLMFTTSDFKNNEESLKSFTEIVGDIETNRQELINKSPVYLTDKIHRPIMMFHGISDRRVTIEHSLRMKEIMDIAQLSSELIILNNEGHSLNNKESEIIYIARSLQFIQKQLLDQSKAETTELTVKKTE